LQKEGCWFEPFCLFIKFAGQSKFLYERWYRTGKYEAMKTFKQYLNEQMIKQKGTQYGSNDGGVHIDSETGKKHYAKFYRNPDQGKAEVLAGKIYKHMGIRTLEPESTTINKKSAVSTEWNDDLHPMQRRDFNKLSPEHAEHIGRMYHAAVLTKNWDVVGMDHDNIMKHKKTGHLHSVDHGGAFHFRAQGGHKDYGPDIAEHESLRNNSHASGHVFRSAFEQHPDAEKKSLDSVRNIDDDHVKSLFQNSGLDNWEEMHHNFNQRKKALLDKYKE